MEYDWSDAWLHEAAGWKAVKEGTVLHQRGLIQNARLNGGECHGVSIGGKQRRVKVTRLSATLAEALCGCPENSRTGAICEHAVAVILAARESKPANPSSDSLAVASVEERLVPAYRIRFFPSWQREWKQNRLTVCVETSNRAVDEMDSIIHQWLENQKISQKPSPWMMNLQGETLESFLRAISGHNEITCEKQTIVCGLGYPQIKVVSRFDDGQWNFSTEAVCGQFLGQKMGPWIELNKHLFEVDRIEDQKILFQLLNEKNTQITDYQYFTSKTLKHILIPESDRDALARLKFCPVSPRWHFHVEGSLRQLRLTIRKQYEVGNRSFTNSMDDDAGFLCQISNECFYATSGDSEGLREELICHGWQWHSERSIWQMTDEQRILTFLGEYWGNSASREGKWTLSPQLTNIREGMIFVKPRIEISSSSDDSSRFHLGFITEQGKPLDAEKIRKLLQSGKRLIQTNDGKSLLLPQESWDVFQRSVGDLQLEQNQGQYWAKKHQAIVIEFLRKYIDKQLVENNLQSNSSLRFPLLNASLREYQIKGADWLHDRLTRYGFCLLADEMGLGKTLQTIAVLSLLTTYEQPALVVVPTSLLNNWRLEVERFAPELGVIVIHGPNRDALHSETGYRVIVTSYGVLMNDRALFMRREYSVMVLDEAGAIRNPDTEVARCVFRMNAKYRLALTGTPLENHLRDLWSIFQYLQPGYLGDRKVFRDTYETHPLASMPALQSLRIRVMPFMLRRTKNVVAKDLPDKIESDEWCELSPEQSKLYQSVWEEGIANVERLRLESESAGRMCLLTLLLRLRQVCCDAALVAPELSQTWSLEQRSLKMKRLFEIFRGTFDSGRKMLVFSQFAQQLQLIQKEFNKQGVETLLLDGSTRNRQEIVDKFQKAEGPSVFLISLKAGGYGLNLTQASTVVHFDPWWNPAAERQASDRAHRIGQTQAVNVYRLLTKGTVEEKVKKLQDEKSKLANLLFDGLPVNTQTGMPSMSQLQDLLRPSV
ncbi:MAG: hypothetical protein RLZZ553_605 [Verrucomicrobiota bacterium]|jgi:superfamily II DNA or RNA helicase